MIRKTLERSRGGVVLIRVEDLSLGERPVALGYRLSTPVSALTITDRDEAHAAFAAEVQALDAPPVPRRRAYARH